MSLADLNKTITHKLHLFRLVNCEKQQEQQLNTKDMKKDNLKMSYAYICLEIMKTNIYTLFSQLYTHIRKSYSFRFRIYFVDVHTFWPYKDTQNKDPPELLRFQYLLK